MINFRGYNVVPVETKKYEVGDKLINCDEIAKIKHLKAQNNVKIAFECDRFIIYTYTIDNVEINVNFNTKPLIEWSKEQLKEVLGNAG
jgi:hypothetical protein